MSTKRSHLPAEIQDLQRFDPVVNQDPCNVRTLDHATNYPACVPRYIRLRSFCDQAWGLGRAYRQGLNLKQPECGIWELNPARTGVCDLVSTMTLHL